MHRCLFAGSLIYFGYGIRKSFGSNVLYQLVPEEERILIPSSPTYNVGAPQAVEPSATPAEQYINLNSQADIDTVLIE